MNRDELLAVLAKEEKNGYTDGAVFGGLAAFLAETAAQAKLPSLAKLAEEYREAPSKLRPAVLAAIEKEVRRTVAQTAAPAQTKTAPEAKPARLATPVRYLKNIGAKRAEILHRLGIDTVDGLLFFLPRQYDDRSVVEKISGLAINQTATVKGEVLKIAELQPRFRMHILKVWIKDETGIMVAVWFNQKFLVKQLQLGRCVLLHGKLEKKYAQLQFLVQDYELLAGMSQKVDGIVPIYRLTEKVSQKTIRKMIAETWAQYHTYISDVIPKELAVKYGFPSRREALYRLHFPQHFAELPKARESLAYEEFLLLQLALLRLGDKKNVPGIAHKKDPKIKKELLAALPFSLTNAQLCCIDEIYRDMEEPKPMARLLQGDVGSGKTVVAAAGLLKAYRSGGQGALMVPTELLAEQHYHDLAPLFASFGAKVALFTGKIGSKERKQILTDIEKGAVDIVIGTHTLIQNEVRFAHLSLAVTDEQHRFGVLQRADLQQKGQKPDVLVMTATPIPRTLAMTLYGDLQLSVLDELPPGRKPIKTYAVSFDYESRVWRFVQKEVAKGRQVYIVCPLLEESEKLDLQSAAELAEKLSQNEFKNLKIALLHGKLKSAEKQRIAVAFRQGEIDVLVATTVVEVGINVPNASVMVVRNAERFGLAQLHQLRGRIGRGREESFCVLLHEAKSDVAKARLQIMTVTNDGFRIAEEDLRLRGPGEFFGTRQHGLPEMKVADIFKDGKWLEAARADAKLLLQSGKEVALFRYVDETLPLWH